MSGVIVSNVPKDATSNKLKDFFSFCGTIDSIMLIDEEENKNKYEIFFESHKAVETALLLNEAEIDGNIISVVESINPPRYERGSFEGISEDNKIQIGHLTGDNTYDKVSQEEKPKYAVLAQILAEGYVVSDSLIQKALNYDKEKGYSAKFLYWLNHFVEGWLHPAEGSSEANAQQQGASMDEANAHVNGSNASTGSLAALSEAGKSKAQEGINYLNERYKNSSYLGTLQQYTETASKTTYGAKANDLYKHLAKDVQDVHKEVQRLIALKKEKNISTESNVPQS